MRCNELCGLWHGAMFNSGGVVTGRPPSGVGGGPRARAAQAKVTKVLPPFALTYDPRSSRSSARTS